MEVVLADSQTAFHDLREKWDTLLSTCSSASIFQTWEWNDSWWRTLGTGKDLLMLQACKNGSLVGLAPLFKTRRMGVQRVIQFIGNGIADYMDVVVADDRKNEICQAILRYLLATQNFDLVDLRELQLPSPLCTEAVRLAGPTCQANIICKDASESCLGISLPSTWEELCSRVGRKMIRSLSYKRRLLKRSFSQVEIRLANETELQDVLTALFDLHQKRWRLRGGRGALGKKKVQAFYRLVAKRFNAKGWLRLHFIRLNGTFAGVACCFQFRHRYYGYLSGFDPELGRYGLGSLLVAEAVRQAIEERCLHFDMLRGEENYKCHWRCGSTLNKNLLFVSSRGLRARLISSLSWLERNFLRMKATTKQQPKRPGDFTYQKLGGPSSDL